MLEISRSIVKMRDTPPATDGHTHTHTMHTSNNDSGEQFSLVQDAYIAGMASENAE